KCKEVGVENEYIMYERRLRTNYLSAFLVLHTIFTFANCILLVCTCDVGILHYLRITKTYLRTIQHPHLIYIDIALYFSACILIDLILSINFFETPPQKNCWIAYITSVLSVIILTTIDTVLHIYHFHYNEWIVTFSFNIYVLCMIYLFLPLPGIKGPVLLGFGISAVYTALFFFLLSNKYDNYLGGLNKYSSLLADIFHYTSFNMLGAFFRYVSDITVRSSFLDRHQYVMEEMWHKSARAHEKKLLDSILPPQIAQPLQDNIRLRIAALQRHSNTQTPMNVRGTGFQIYQDVSILYADVVNYTHLTTTLTVQELVALLHDLYGRFDKAAQLFEVQRIKFLGDCYYCVAGLIHPNPDHAKSCVDLGHLMIGNIREVRTTRNLNIDMRIGVHSGSVLAGVIGEAKLQFDIYGENVLIANKLESTGLPGYIHISGRTLSNLWNETYEILPGTQQAKEDPILLKYDVITYLIAGIEFKGSLFDSSKSELLTEDTEIEKKERIKLELHKEFKSMPVDIFKKKNIFKRNNENTSRPIMDTVFLQFKDPRLDFYYMRQPDYLLKYSVLLSWCVHLTLVYEQENEFYGEEGCQVVVLITFTSLTILLIIFWYKELCIWKFGLQEKRYSAISCLIFKIVESAQRSLLTRFCIYMATITAHFAIISTMLVECDDEELILFQIETKIYYYEVRKEICFHPWVMTQMICLIVCMSWIFTGIPFTMKFIVTIIEALSYAIIMLFEYQYIIRSGISTNPSFHPEYSHTVFLVISWLTQYIMEREFDFNSKINYNWRVDLLKKQQDAHLTNKSIIILLHNILPSHVVNVYLTSLENHELYYENFEMVAVMFATLKNFQVDVPNLRILHEIITEFDKILEYYKSNFLVEKIKIVGCTYMAASGIDLRFPGIIRKRRNSSDSVINEAQNSIIKYNDNNNVKVINNEEVVFVLTTFALDLMRTLWLVNEAYSNIPIDRARFTRDMSVGISSGEVMAGVVGASQVHYDIWGNSVNMASRMDSTGVPGRIQVTEESAKSLAKCGIACKYRGLTYVKGRGKQPTYFVEIDENLEFM
ncbi:hypothetical protein KR222_006972, partial [Zaprionus bogoriensis]